MVNVRINGLDLQAVEGWTVMEAAGFLGIRVPTLCYHEGLSPYGACRMCVVEIGEGANTKLVSSCTYPVSEGLNVRTHSVRVMKARMMMIELHVALCPSSRVVQDLAAELNLKQVRFEPRNEDCILCGLCVRMCAEQMDGQAIGFVDRGNHRRITTPFDIKSDVCRQCGGCMYICPACQLRCQGPEPPGVLCGSCVKFEPTCLDHFEDMQCWMGTVAECGGCVREKPGGDGNEKQ